MRILKSLCNSRIFSLYFNRTAAEKYFNRTAAEKSTATQPVLPGFL